MRTPNWIELAVLALGIFRIVRLVGWDDITARVRAWVTVSDASYDTWIEVQHAAEQRDESFQTFISRSEGTTPPSPFRWWLARLIRCPWCLGVWLTIPVWLCWLSWPDGTVGAMTPLALMAVVGLVAKNLDP